MKNTRIWISDKIFKHFMHWKVLFFIIVIVTSVSITEGKSYAATGKAYNIDKDDLPYKEEEIYNQLFDINNKVEISIDIADGELQKLQEDYENYSSRGSKSPIYRKANVTITITTSSNRFSYYIEEVGVRMKGNTSRLSFYNNQEGMYNLIHFKLNFQETFDDVEYYGNSAVDWTGKETARKIRKNRTFATLEKLDMKWNRGSDNTYVREYYAFEMFRAFDVLAPHTNLCSTDVSDMHLGVYMIYEPIDKVFINKYVDADNQGGDLYKCGWVNYYPADFSTGVSIGIEDEDSGLFYNYDLKTNKKTSDHTQLRNLINILNSDNLTKTQYESVIDESYFINYAAAAYFIGDSDDMRNNYNNYYIYFMKSTGKVVFIPYDMDKCLRYTNIYTTNPMSNITAKGNRQENPIVNYSIIKNAWYTDEFSVALLTMGNSKWMTESNFKKIYDIAENNYLNDVKPSKNFKNAVESRFYFSLTKSFDVRSTSFADYIELLLSKYKEELTVTKLNQTVTSNSDTYSRTYGCNPIKLYAKTSGDGTLTYKSSDINIATVSDSGIVTVKGSGTVNITVKAEATPLYNEAVKTITLVVKQKQQNITSYSDAYSRSYGCNPIKLYAKTDGNGSLTYKSSNTNVATVSSEGTVTVKGVGTVKITVKASATSQYQAADKIITIVIKPRQQVIKSLTSTARGKITVTHSADYTASGFQISYATRSDFKNSKKVIVNSRTNMVKNINGLKSGQRYYVKVRAFKYAGNKTYYGAFSEKQSIVVK